MAVVEHKTTNVTTETRDGTTIERIFKMTISDWSDGTFTIRLGDSFNSDNPNLRVTSMRKVPEDNVNMIAIVLYSTESSTTQDRRADENDSWQETLDFGFQEFDDDTFYSRGVSADTTIAGVTTSARDASFLSFNSAYASYRITASAAGIVVPATPPVFTQRKGVGSMVVRMYGSELHLARIMNSLPVVNSTPFIQQYFTAEQSTSIISDAQDLADDTGFWLFTGCPTSRVNPTTWEYNWTFEFSPFFWRGIRMKWNEPFGFPLNNYFAKDFNAVFFAGMKKSTTQTLLGGNR